MTGHMDLWNKLGKTDPQHTKAFKRAGGFGGTAIKPIYTEQKMTETFGPCGVGWGINEPVYQVVPASEGQVAVYCTTSIWINHDGKVSAPIYGVGGDLVVVKQSAGLRTDDEAFKKAFTDAVGNAMKHLGMSADVHMGLFDDSKYVNERKAEEAAAAAPIVTLAFDSHSAGIRGATGLPALKVAFEAARADKSLTKEQAEEIIRLKEQRKAELSPPPKNLGEQLDRMLEEQRAGAN